MNRAALTINNTVNQRPSAFSRRPFGTQKTTGKTSGERAEDDKADNPLLAKMETLSAIVFESKGENADETKRRKSSI